MAPKTKSIEPKVKSASRASKPGKEAVKPKTPAKAKPSAAKAKPAGAREGGKSGKAGKGDGQATGPAASKLIDKRIRDLNDWRGETLARMRALILESAPGMIEEWKWMGTPVWSNDGMVCTGESYKSVVKLTFAKGASLPDPARLFNSSLEGNTRRAIDIQEGEKVDAGAFKALIKAAVALNGSKAKKR
ncbi:MAG: hypothetical protein JWP91_4049 [Fibrobacteres bacterium]|nr:hypothetical protein [Fibrobacterota bacterium]